MTEEYASQIANLLNHQNELSIKYDAEKILKKKDEYVWLLAEDQKTIAACAEIKSVQWYQWEILHVSVLENLQGKGYGKLILLMAEDKAIAVGAKILQCTIRANNMSSIGLIQSNGYWKTCSFRNPMTKNWVNVYQKCVSS